MDRRNGGALLLDAAAALGCSDESLEVKAAACMSKCPNRDVVLRGADGAMRTVSASGLDGAVEAAAEWLEQSGARTTTAVRQGFAAKVEGEEALRSGEAQQAVERFDAALADAGGEPLPSGPGRRAGTFSEAKHAEQRFQERGLDQRAPA